MHLKFPPDSAMLDAFVRQDAFIDLLFACDVLKMNFFFMICTKRLEQALMFSNDIKGT